MYEAIISNSQPEYKVEGSNEALNIIDHHMDSSESQKIADLIYKEQGIRISDHDKKFYFLVDSKDEKVVLQYIFFAIQRASPIKASHELAHFVPRVMLFTKTDNDCLNQLIKNIQKITIEDPEINGIF